MEEKQRPNKLTYRTVNDTGFIVESKCRLPELKCYEENNSILFWVTAIDFKGNEVEVLQYLTPEVAMKMSKALQNMAINKFKENN